ncbi:MAG: TetR/AcrR family transcriptional regulator [Acidimicrobiia bacterium]
MTKIHNAANINPVATQSERRGQTRTALLDAAACLFAERGVSEASVDAIAEAAGRTSGAVYDHFGSKEGLLFALLEGWVDDVTAVVSAELLTATTLEERMAALWRNVSDPAVDGRWISLEHEMWSYAARHASARERLAERYRAAWDGIDGSSEWADAAPGGAMGPAVIGLLLGLEMMRRVDPTAVTDEMAVAALCSVVAGASTGAER